MVDTWEDEGGAMAQNEEYTDASLQRGLAQSAAGETTDLGDFTQYADSDPEMTSDTLRAANEWMEADEEAARSQGAEDDAARAEDPWSPVVRAANPEVGGESFGYGN